MSEIDKFLKYEQKLRYFEGWVSSVEKITKDDGSCYVNFSIPLKMHKDDAPDWLNCRVYGTNLALRFFNECQKGTKVGIWGLFKLGQTQEGKSYCNFLVKNYYNLEKRQPKTDEGV